MLAYIIAAAPRRRLPSGLDGSKGSYIYIYIYIDMYIYIYIYVYMYMCVCMCIYIYIYTYTHSPPARGPALAGACMSYDSN